MRLRSVFVVALLAIMLSIARCGGDHSSPSAPETMGTLRFEDSGCSCSVGPNPPITVFVDGNQYSFPLFGSINIALTPGSHGWALSAGMAPTTVQIVAGRTVTEHIFSNVDCTDGCGSGMSAV